MASKVGFILTFPLPATAAAGLKFNDSGWKKRVAHSEKNVSSGGYRR